MTGDNKNIELIKSAAKLLKNSIMAKVLMIGLIMFALNIPQYLILDLVKEREKRSREVSGDISQKWGKEQKLVGPILYLPKLEKSLFPKSLELSAKLDPSKRYKSLFSTIVYSAELNYKSEFDLSAFKESDLLDSQLVYFVSDLKGLNKKISLDFASKKVDAVSGVPQIMQAARGFHFPLVLSPQNKVVFECDFNLSGSKKLHIHPSGRQSKIDLNSSWPHPGFNGTYLPFDYQVNDQGFYASWEVHDLQRSFTQSWLNLRAQPTDFLELDLVEVDGHYFQVNRIVKYSLLFLAFTFGAVFICERIGCQTIHPLQYILFGFGGLIFYLLLLSLSEHISFGMSYLSAALMCSGMIGFYSKGVLQSKKQALGIFCLISLLYSYLYGTIQLEDYALLMGSLGLFVILGLLMFFTRDLSSKKELTYE